LRFAAGDGAGFGGRLAYVTGIVITGAGGPLGANVTRSLRSAPEPVHLVGTEANRWHLPLSLCDVTYRVPYARDKEAYAAALRAVAARNDVQAIIPTHPVEVRAVAELAASGALSDLGTALPELSVIEMADDKVVTQRRLAAAGIPVPETVLLREPADIDRAFAHFGTPVWVRGTGAPGLGIGAAALPCRDREVARAWVVHHDGWGAMAASEFLPGANLTWMAVFANGQLLAQAARQRLEYVLPHVAPSGITGAPAVSQTIARADVRSLGEAAVRALDSRPHGPYFVDCKEDASGAPRVTEINAGRCGTTVQFYTEAGCNFPWLVAQLALGRTVAPAVDSVEPGLYWVRTLDCGPVLVRGAAGFDQYEDAV
jgi:biotin carboxylase